MNKKWVLAVGTGTLLLMSAAGIGIGHASTLPVNSESPAITKPAQARGADTEVKAGVDRDSLQVQQGSQVQDVQGTDTKSGTGEQSQAKESDAGPAGGGHADPNGANVNQDYQGVQ